MALLTREQLCEYILRRLGAPQVTVELVQEDLEQAVDDAVQWFIAKKGVIDVLELAALPVSGIIPLPDDVDVVTDIAFPSPKFDFAQVYQPQVLPEQGIPYGTLSGGPETMGRYSHITQVLQYIEMAKRTLGVEPDWRQENRRLLVFPPPRDSGKCFIFFKSRRCTIEQLDERDHLLVKEYALARAKEKWGRVLSKYQDFPTAQGSTSFASGPALLDEAKADFERLDELIDRLGFAAGFMTG